MNIRQAELNSVAREQRDPALRWIGIVLLAGMVLALFFTPLVNLDSALYLQIGYRLLAGQIPYVDYFETNPPLIHYLSVIPVWISETLRADVSRVFFVVGFLLAAGSSWMLYAVLRRHSGESADEQRIARALGLLPLLFSLAMAYSHFGQREHLYILMILPAFALRYTRWHQRAGATPISLPLTVLIGVMAGIGAGLKPHFLLPLALVELYWLLRWRRIQALFQPEVAGLAAFFALYALHFLIVPAAMRANFFGVLLPQMATAYDSYGANPPLAAYLDDGALWIVIALVLGLLIRPNGRDDTHHLGWSLALLLIGMLAVYVLQNKGWLYHIIPAQLVALLLVALLALRRSSGRAWLRPAARRVLFWTLGGLIVAQPVTFSLLADNIRLRQLDAMEQIIRDNSQPEAPVLLISTAPTGQIPLVRAHRRSVGTYPVNYPLAFAYGAVEQVDEAFYADPFPLPPLAEAHLQTLAQDIAADQPALIMIDREASCIACPRHFQISRFLEATGFIEQHILPGYDFIGSLDYFDFYRLKMS